jgi:hypothetical protein
MPNRLKTKSPVVPAIGEVVDGTELKNMLRELLCRRTVIIVQAFKMLGAAK